MSSCSSSAENMDMVCNVVDGKDITVNGKDIVVSEIDVVDDAKDIIVDGKDMVVDGKVMIVDGKDMVIDGKDMIVDGIDTANGHVVREDPDTKLMVRIPDVVEMDVENETIRNSEDDGPLSSGTAHDSSIINAEEISVFRGVEEGKAPLWVKWRGKWRAGVQCSLEDCPAQTVQAMPTYGRKSYILVFFPKNHSFVWTDWQLTCCISENPQPLSFGSHKSGRNSVVDLNIAKTFMLRKIATSMLDISDQLPVTAVENCARDVRFWKDVANEAAKTSTYQELGSMLVKLKTMILSSVIQETWINTRVLEWEHECRNAKSARSLEILVKELKNAVCWDEVDKLWSEYEQENLGSEWQSWKKRSSHDSSYQEKSRCSSFRRRTFDASVNSPEESEGNGGSGNGGNTESEQDNKRLKLAQETISDSPELYESISMDLEMEKNVDIVCSLDAINKTPKSGLKSNNYKRDVEVNPQSKSSRCLAFSKRRKRQCNRYAKGGALYCYKHIPSSCNEGPSASSTNGEKGKLPISNIGESNGDVGICNGTTKYGRRCRHKAKDGSVFCSTHTLHDLEKCGKSEATEKSVIPSSETFLVKSNLGMSAEPSIAELKGIIEQTDVQVNSLIQETSKCIPKSTRRNRNTVQCIGWCGSGAQCSHRARLGFSYCEKHIPGSSPYAQRGQERAHCKEISGKTPNNKQEVNISQLKNITHDYMRVRLSNTEAQSSEQMINMVLKEVSGNLKASEALYDLVTSEMEELKQCVDEKDISQVQNSLDPCLTGSVDHTTSSKVTIGEEDIVEEKDPPQVQNYLVPSLIVAVDHASGSLKTIVEENCVREKDPSQVQNSLVPFVGEVKSIEHLSNIELLKQVSSARNGHLARYRCKLCTQEFIDLIVLGEHWRGCHNREAQQYFRGYSCQYCKEPFRNKKGLYRHRKTHHAEMVSQTKSSLIATCIICNGQFGKFESLWKHVICSHPEQLFAFWPVTDPSLGLINGFFQWQPSGLEIADLDKKFHSGEKFVTNVELQQDTEISEKVISDEVIANKVIADEVIADEVIADNLIAGDAIADNVIASDMIVDKVIVDEVIADKVIVEKGISEKGIADKVIGDRVNNLIVVEKAKQPSILEATVKHPSCDSESELKFKCKICGLRFRLLPDLGRHHQAEHKPVQATISKNINEESLFTGISEDVKPIIGLEKEKRKPQKLNIRRAPPSGKANTEVQTDNKDEKNWSMGKIEGYTGTKFEGFPISQSLKSHNIILDEKHITFTCAEEKACHKMILCEDLSFGKERVPIPCILDSDVMGKCACSVCVDNPNNHFETLTPWLEFSYVTKRTVDPSLGLDTETSRSGCSCLEHQCLPTKCEHVYLVDSENSDAEDVHGKSMTARFPYDDRGCMILEEGHLVYECNSLCRCSTDCGNRVLQKGVQVKLEVYKTRHKGWAVRAAQHIPRGTFVCEYIGEVLDDSEENRRRERYCKERCSYVYDIKTHIDVGHLGKPKLFFIDATKFGNVARFINHSCSPNLVNYQVLVEGMDCPLAHVGLYATHDIQIGEELGYDYHCKLLVGKGSQCYCGAKDCRGSLN